ncbi:hypothetical protein DIURU_001144 [Diutina rugosa]|uniref:Opaque-phase-specific protein OP4 n=1 Tax=Diutina rugosa TaxID=5481 RepID=A0A642UV00_DIURU|nr:uncharacterized protein DIURU_001144 [Diutina rugosa]KAA8906202.1 hypothetical protein DIURU_001144 [Diutina rugosa]
MRFGILQSVFLVVLAAFTFALPVQTVEEDTQLTFLNDLFARDIGMEIPRDVEENWALVQRGIEEGYYDVDVLAKREVKVLTDLFLSMNKTGAGVQLIKGFATNPVTQSTTIQAVVSFIKTQDLGKLLKAAADSGLATDIVLMLFTHMEAFKGLVKVGKALFTQGIIKFKRDAFMKRDGFAKRDIFGSIWNGIQNIFGWGSSGSSGSTQQQSTPTTKATATATAQQQQQQTQQTQQGATPPPTPAPPRSSQTGTVPAIVLSGSAVTNLGESKITASAVPAQGSVSSGISVAPPNSASVAQQAGELATAAGVNTNAPLPTFDANAIPTGESAAADAIKMFNQLQGNNPAPVTVSNTAGQVVTVAPAGIFGNIIGGIISGVGGVVDGVGQVVGGIVSGVGGVVSGIFDGVGQVVTGVTKTLMGILDNAQKTLFTGLLNAINLAGSFDDICVSLQKSGFGVSVAYSLFADSEMHDFDLKTVKAAIDQDALSLSRILSAASSSGIVTRVITDLFSSSKNSSITFSFFVQVLFNFKSIFFS